MNAADVAVAVRRHYGCESDDIGPEWAALSEFTLSPGGRPRIDLLMVRAWSGKPARHERHAIEIKVDRGDLRAEIARPDKRAPFVAVTHRFYFATPAGLVRDGELPAGVGLLEVGDRGVRRTVTCPRREPDAIPEGAFVEAFRRASRHEARVRAAATLAVEDPERAALLERALAAARRQVATRDEAIERERARVRQLVAVLADQAQAYCKCGEPMSPDRASRHPYLRWVHRLPAPDCVWPELDVDRLAAALAPLAIDRALNL